MASTFQVTSGSAIITDAFGGPESGTFHLIGLQVDVTASGGSTPSLEVTQLLGVPFNLNLNVLVNDIGGDGGSGFVGGVNYPSLSFNGPSLRIANISPITISAGNLKVTTPAILSGSLQGCVTANACIFGIGTPTFPFDLNIAPIAGLLTVTYVNTNPPVSSQYALASAVFVTTIPEPGTWVAGLSVLLVVAATKFRKQGRLG